MNSIKQRRLTKALRSHPELCVGDCVPFYFCPRSVMLYVISRGNHPELEYRGGQVPIVHLEADLYSTIEWADTNSRRWAFTSSNAGSFYFVDYADLNLLDRVDWAAVQATKWSGPGIADNLKEGKQAEFLVESLFPWELVTRIGIKSPSIYNRVQQAMVTSAHRPTIEVKPDWYYQ